MPVYRVTSDTLELKKGKKIPIDRQPLKTGALYIFELGSFLILGRWFPGWIIQPGRWIEVGHAAMKVISHVTRIVL